jgi:hypothetical protein
MMKNSSQKACGGPAGIPSSTLFGFSNESLLINLEQLCWGSGDLDRDLGIVYRIYPICIFPLLYSAVDSSKPPGYLCIAPLREFLVPPVMSKLYIMTLYHRFQECLR